MCVKSNQASVEPSNGHWYDFIDFNTVNTVKNVCLKWIEHSFFNFVLLIVINNNAPSLEMIQLGYNRLINKQFSLELKIL